MATSNKQSILHVFYLNTILNSSPGYGANLGAGKRLSLVDANGNSPFAGVDNGTLYFPNINSPKLDGGIYAANAAEVSGVVYPKEPNTSLTANTIYSFYLRQWNPYKAIWIQGTISYDTSGGNSTTTGAATTAWQAQITNMGFQVTFSGGGTQTLTVTAATGYPILSMSGLNNITAGTTAVVGVPSIGVSEGTNNTLGDLNYLLPSLNSTTYASYSGYIATNAYDIYHMTYVDNNDNNHVFKILVNTGATHYSNLTSYFLETILELGGANPNISMIQQATAPENLSIS